MSKKISDYTNETSALKTYELLLDNGSEYKALAIGDLLVDSNLPLYWDGSDNVYIANGSFFGIAGTASGQTPDSNANSIVVDGNANGGMSILSGSSNLGIFYFGDTTDASVAGFKYSHSTNTLTIRTNANDNIIVGSDGSLSLSNGFYNCGTPTELTISGGSITATKSFHTVDTEGDAASDDLDTITGGTLGDILIITSNNASRTVVAKDGTGNLKLAGDFSMDDNEDTLTLIYTGSVWQELARSNNA